MRFRPTAWDKQAQGKASFVSDALGSTWQERRKTKMSSKPKARQQRGLKALLGGVEG